MTTTIDHAGRLVIPKRIREMAGLQSGAELEVEYRDGKIEIEPRAAEMTLRKVGRRVVIVAPRGTPQMTVQDVETVRQEIREESERKRYGVRKHP